MKTERRPRSAARRKGKAEQLVLPLDSGPVMQAASLQSGSNGNCIFVEAGGVRLLFDAGITGAETGRRLAALGRTMEDVSAVIISHDHADHMKFAGVYQRKYGLPVYMTHGTRAVAEGMRDLGRLFDVRIFRPGDRLSFGDVTVETMRTPHDAEEGAVFVVACRGRRLGVMTDLGHLFPKLRDTIGTLDAVFLESNYDTDMLMHGPYPAFLKKRIRGHAGHISNHESAELLREGKKLKWACLSHLSEQNNSPAVALKTHRDIVGADLILHTAHRYEATGLFEV
ncbi:MAG: MBL fold metallo-hydrolase [Nitrospiraceae bacterium]|nr:MBL fold metallo-hydrolase [Nitrospiraceae bacterium]